MSAHWKQDSLTRRIEQSKTDMLQRTQEIAGICGGDNLACCLNEAEERLTLAMAKCQDNEHAIEFYKAQLESLNGHHACPSLRDDHLDIKVRNSD